MGLRTSLILRTLGRSPFEPPEEDPANFVSPRSDPANRVEADGYVQRYDSRGHPINPKAKVAVKELRRAGNDVLSTLASVATGEMAGPAVIRERRRRMNQLTDENRLGLILTNANGFGLFMSSWWAMTLSDRIQAFSIYNHLSVVDIIFTEIRTLGLGVFSFSGFLVWAISYLVHVSYEYFQNSFIDSFCERLSSFFPSIHKNTVKSILSYVRLGSWTFVMQAVLRGYLFSLYQSLNLLPTSALPSFRDLISLRGYTSVQFPLPPAKLIPLSMLRFLVWPLQAPMVLAYILPTLQVLLSNRIQRIIWRRFPKPDHPETLSVKVAKESGLLEWAAPGLGKMEAEEQHRVQLTLLEDVLYEVAILKEYVSDKLSFLNSWLSMAVRKAVTVPEISPSEIENELRFNFAQGPTSPFDSSENLFSHSDGEGARFGQCLSELEELHRNYYPGTQLPLQLPTGRDNLLLGDQVSTNEPLDANLVPFSMNGPVSRDQSHRVHRPRSFSNALFSHPPSSESSPITSPRVRASLIHHSYDDEITMQLELLERHASQNQPQETGRASRFVEQPSGSSQFRQIEPDENTEFGRSVSTIENFREMESRINPRSNQLTSNTVPPPDINADFMSDIFGTEATRVQTAFLELDPVFPDFSHLVDPRFTSDDTVLSGAEAHRSRSLSRHHSTPTVESWIHHSTTLSMGPSDIISSRLANVIADILLLPLRAIYVRSAANFFLAHSHDSPLPVDRVANAVGLHHSSRGVNSWFGGGNFCDMMIYAGKLATVFGIQTLVSANFWRLLSSLVTIIGRRKFGWGTL